MRVATIVGARPQFIKAAPVSRAFAAAGIDETIIHTGQHYDRQMSEVFFRDLDIPAPAVDLEVGSGAPAAQTAQVIERVERVLGAEKVDWVVVYGDTNSTLGGAIAASKCELPLAHIEAGLRSYNRAMPEEHNRVVTDHIAQLLLCPTESAATNLSAEGLIRGVHVVGDVMLDAVLQFSAVARASSRILDQLDLEPGGYLLATVHRNTNTDDPRALRALVEGLAALGEPVVFPVHPRTRKELARLVPPIDLDETGLRAIDPLSYLDMLVLQENARAVLTDSGGVQKEAFFLGVPCVTLRDETEWIETVACGWNRLVGSDPVRLAAAVAESLERPPPAERPSDLFGRGDAAERIAALLLEAGEERGAA